MNHVFNLIRTSFEWGLYLALIGGLGEATVDIAKRAHEAKSKGLVSLRAINRSLQ